MVQISVPQVKSLYEASAHINQPCAPGSVRHTTFRKWSHYRTVPCDP